MKTCIYNTIKAKIIYKMLQDNHRLVQGNVHVKESLNNVILRVDFTVFTNRSSIRCICNNVKLKLKLHVLAPRLRSQK